MIHFDRPKQYAGWALLLSVLLTFNAAGSDATGEKAKRLAGGIGASARWGSGWIDLNRAMDFAVGDRLRLRVGGTAQEIVVRLLPENEFPDTPTGLVGGVISVPTNRIVEIVLDSPKESIVQISVHGGSRAWSHRFSVGNGPATLESVELVRR